jgi:predicted dehydrogenase/nucleoside-diphosphate-sugar epimerase
LSKKQVLDPLRVGFLGTGYIAEWHVSALKTIPGVELVAVCDKASTRAASFGRRHKIDHVYDALEKMLGDKNVHLDVVHVLLPPDLHASAAAFLLDQGVDVFLEKPMATTTQECDDLVAKAASAGRSLGIGHNFLFMPVYEQLRSDLRSGKLGRPDQITITWNRGLDQLQTGPFNLWMLRDPRNIILEIGPHCLALMLDLVGRLEVTGVQVSNRVSLPANREFYRRWIVQAGTGAIGVSLNFSFTPGFTEQTVHIRGTVASATVDFERNTYLLHQHTRHGLDIDRYQMLRREAGSLVAQARRTLSEYALSKFKLSTKGNPYGVSITRALQSFYSGLGQSIDTRLSPQLGRDVVDLCSIIGRLGTGGVATSSNEMPTSTLAASPPQSRAEIVVLGATGFIGQELARQLVARGHAIRVLVRDPSRLADDLQGPNVEVITGDLTRLEDLEKAITGSRIVYHLARANVKTWEEFTEQDIEVTRKVADFCLALSVQRLIYTGTIDSYYAGANAGTITEETPLDPQISWRNLYARAKAASEEILGALYREKGLPVVVFRPGIVIGPGGSPFHWGIGMWSWNAVCQIWGKGRTPLPFVLVDDVVQALIAGMCTLGIEGQSFNLVANSDLSAVDYLKALESCSGVAFQKFPTPPWSFYATDMAKWVVKQLVRHPDQRKPSYRDWESRTQRAHYDCGKARRMLNWKPVDDRHEMIHRGIQLPAAEFMG